MVAEISQFLLGSNIPTCLTSFSSTCPFSSVSVPHTSFASPPEKVLEFCCTLPPFSSFFVCFALPSSSFLLFGHRRLQREPGIPSGSRSVAVTHTRGQIAVQAAVLDRLGY